MAEDAPLVDAAGFLAGLQGAAAPVAPEGPAGGVWRGLLRDLSERTAETAGRVAKLVPAERLLVIGGGAASRPWMREKADVVSLPIVRPRTAQAVARGAAVFAGQAAGWWPSPEEAPMPVAAEV